MLIILIAIKDIEEEQVDVNNVFTELKLHKTIYIKPPSSVKIQLGFTLCLL